MNAAKNPYRKLVYSDSLDSDLHIAASQISPDVNTLVGNKQCRFYQWWLSGGFRL